MKKIKEIFFHSLIKYLLLFVIDGIAIAMIMIFGKGKGLIDYSNAFFVVGFLNICIGGLSIVSYLGAFDMFSYSFYYMGSFIKHTEKEKNRKYDSLPDFVDKKNIERSKDRYKSIPYIVWGTLLCVISAIILLVM